MSGGIYVAQGMTLALTNISISFSTDGSDKVESTMLPKVGFDACIPWLGIALEHLSLAQAITLNSNSVWSGVDEKAKGELLGKEFRASMQAIVAAAIAIDAFYSRVQHSLRTDKTSPPTRHRRRAPRYAQVAECLKCAFKMRQENFRQLRGYLKQIYNFRDKGVHPSGGLSDPVLHPEMKVGIEFRFVTFRYGNAHPIVQVAIEMVAQLAAKGHPTNKALHDYCAYLQTMIAPLRASEILRTTSVSDVWPAAGSVDTRLS
jgi:hypothetical protein